MKITDALVVEHGVFRRLFELVEREVAVTATLDEVQAFARVVEGLLRVHGELEEEVVFAAFDHVLEQRGERDRFYQEHQELDGRWQRVQEAALLAQARRRLHGAMEAARRHFRHEEEVLIPAVEASLNGDTLEELGASWERRALRATA